MGGWQIRFPAFNSEPQSRGQLGFLPWQTDRARLREKSLRLGKQDPYRKPPQVDEASSLRGTGDSSLRNSAKKLGVTSGEALPAWSSDWAGRSERFPGDCLTKTQLPANS